jgi:hypothetical protein
VRPQGEKSPIGSVYSRHECPYAVDLGDVAGNEGEHVGHEGCCGTYS